MKKLILLVFMLQGCALYWSDNCLIITCMKDYDLKELTSTSQKLKAKATAEYPPTIEIETKGKE